MKPMPFSVYGGASKEVVREMSDYHFFVHPNRDGKGPALWGYVAEQDTTEIIFGSLQGPMRHQTKHARYWVDKVSEKRAKGYLPVTAFPADKVGVFIGKVVQIRHITDWNRIPMKSLHPKVAQALKSVRSNIGLDSSHPSDSDPIPPDSPPVPRRANPEPTMVIRIPPKKTVSWMF